MTELIICSAAEADFSAALNWYATHSPQAAANFDEEVSRAIVAISFDPERLPACDVMSVDDSFPILHNHHASPLGLFIEYPQ